jgi:hypothetical protein
VNVVVANLDCESVWAGGPALPAAVASRLALLATTLRVYCAEDDALWLPAPVDPSRIPLDAAPRPRLITGPLPPDAVVRLAWAASPERPEQARAPGVSSERPEQARAQASARPRADSIARSVNDRRFAARLAEQLGIALPGARIIASVEELAAHLAHGGADASPDGSWVAKALWSAAGRDRVRRRGAVLDDATRTRVERLLAVHGALAFEPWMPRLLDVGQGGTVDERGAVTLHPPHRGLVDAGGVVRGIGLDGGAALEPAERTQLAAVASAAGDALHAAGYIGPFVVDAFVYGHGGARVLHPLCEVNARLTFGLVARAWADHLAAPSLTLGLGGDAPAGATPLVLDDTGAALAWLSVSS